jgi:hypothetical protein
VEGK